MTAQQPARYGKVLKPERWDCAGVQIIRASKTICRQAPSYDGAFLFPSTLLMVQNKERNYGIH